MNISLPTGIVPCQSRKHVYRHRYHPQFFLLLDLARNDLSCRVMGVSDNGIATDGIKSHQLFVLNSISICGFVFELDNTFHNIIHACIRNNN